MRRPAASPSSAPRLPRPRPTPGTALGLSALIALLGACVGGGEASDEPADDPSAEATPAAASTEPFPSFEPLRFDAYGLELRVPTGFEVVGGSGRGDRRVLASSVEELRLEIEVGELVARPGLESFLTEARRGVERVSRQDTLPRGVEVLGFDPEGHIVRRRLVQLAPSVVLRLTARYPSVARVRAGAIADSVFTSPTFTGDFTGAPGDPGPPAFVPQR